MTAVIAMPRLATAAVLEDRRALVQAARKATGQVEDPARPSATPAKPPARQPSPLAQTAQVFTAWAYMTPFLLAAPFFVVPPLWIAALAKGRQDR